MEASKYSRFKGLDWFQWLKGREVIIGGAGGIGSWLCLALSRLGCEIYLYDFDEFDNTNMSGQLVRHSDIGKSKTSVAVDIAKEFALHEAIEEMPKYTKDSEACPIMISAFDNMEARTNMFRNWKNNTLGKDSIFIDGRLLAEQYQIFCIHGDNEAQIEKYEKEYLFDDSEVEAVDCTTKQTSHCAMTIAGHIVEFLTNFAANRVVDDKFMQIPFQFERIVKPNVFSNEYI